MVYGLAPYEKHTYREISEKTNLSEASLMSMKKRSIQKLQKASIDEFIAKPLIEEVFYESNFNVDYDWNIGKVCHECGVESHRDAFPGGRGTRCRKCCYIKWTNERKRYRGENPRSFNYRRYWEEHNGPIPKGNHIHHIDGDSNNNKLSNLQCVTPLEHYEIHKSQGDTAEANLLYAQYIKNKKN